LQPAALKRKSTEMRIKQRGTVSGKRRAKQIDEKRTHKKTHQRGGDRRELHQQKAGLPKRDPGGEAVRMAQSLHN